MLPNIREPMIKNFLKSNFNFMKKKNILTQIWDRPKTIFDDNQDDDLPTERNILIIIIIIIIILITSIVIIIIIIIFNVNLAQCALSIITSTIQTI